jgi:CheY-like chemotaxis protein
VLPRSFRDSTTTTPRILIVDDDADTRARYHDAFAGAGCEVVEAADGHDALVKALVHPPTLVLTELQLPLLDGVAFCEVLRRDGTTTNVPILVITTETRMAELDRARTAGATAVFTKTTSLGDIFAESQRQIARRHAPPEGWQVARRNIDRRPGKSATRIDHPELLRRTPVHPEAGRMNRLLSRLPAQDFQRLSPHLRTVRVRRKQVLQKQGEPIEHVYFPNGGLYSIVSVLSTGEVVETATVGDEGMLGIEAFLTEGAVAAGETMMQVPDADAVKLSVEVLRQELARSGALHRLLGRYSQVLVAQMMQSAACIALHQVRQRAARWLLTTHDHVHHQDFALTHEFLAMMLGVSRPTVSEVAAALQRAGLVRYAHGHVKVLDRQGLESESCECYATIRAHFDGRLEETRRSVAQLP